MDDKITIAIIGAGAGLLSGTVASLIAPWVNWGVEKKRQKLLMKGELVKKWRVLVQNAQASSGTMLRDALVNRVDFFSLRPHLSEETLTKITTWQIGSVSENNALYGDIYSRILKEIDQLEKDWKLL